MDIILIPGLWLGGLSWDAIAPPIEEAGHRAHALTLPGMESPESNRIAVGLEDQVEAVVSTIDASDGPVMLVGHSAGGGVAHAAVDARPDRVARVIYVGGFPTPDGEPIAAGFATEAGDIRLPPWEEFEEADLAGLDDVQRTSFRDRAVPSPARLTTDVQRLSDERRFEVPVTVVCTEFTSELLQGWIEQGLEPVREFPQLRHVEYVDLPTGHWPQLSRPAELAAVIVERAYEPEIDEYGRIHPPVGAGEIRTTIGFLEYQRATLAWKAGGLSPEQLNATAASSTLTLGSLLKHMAWVEDHWFARWLHGRQPSSPWDAVDWESNQNWEFTSAAADAPDELWDLWKKAVGRSRALVAAALAEGGLDHVAARPGPAGEQVSLRWILMHMIEEYARHNGHADLLRESIDGQTGE